jgi:hypothetical protein
VSLAALVSDDNNGKAERLMTNNTATAVAVASVLTRNR